jgi:hypothetical protein
MHTGGGGGGGDMGMEAESKTNSYLITYVVN